MKERNINEKRLVDAARGGDQSAFNRLITPHHATLRRYFLLHVRADIREDLLQETLIAAWQGLQTYQSRCRFKQWLFGIAIHRCADYRRKERREGMALHSFADAIRPHESHRNSLCKTLEQQETARKALLSLSTPQREVLELYYYAGFTLDEIAQLLRRNLSTVKYQFYHGHTRAAETLRSLAPCL